MKTFSSNQFVGVKLARIVLLLCLCFLPLSAHSSKAYAQQKVSKVTGKVSDKNGEPIIGASVMIAGTKDGTITDMDGLFSINVAENAILDISCISYLTQQVSVNGKNNLIVILNDDTQSLDEVVVVGYGVQKKANLSGAVETVSAQQLENRATSNLGIALQGLVPNLQISPNGGAADAEPSFNIRGATSINGGSPLILVDGIPTSDGDFARINPLDVENISVLKDASSAAIYGARASFGVILVTTKKGQGEKIQVHFNNNYQVRQLSNMPKVVQDPYIQAYYKNVMGRPWYNMYADVLDYAQQRTDDPSLPVTIINPADPNSWISLATTDWYGEIFNKFASSHQHSVSLSGSSKKASYYLGADYYSEDGLLKINTDKYDRFNVRSNLEYRPFDFLTVGNNTAFTYYTYTSPTAFGSWLFSDTYHEDCLHTVYNPDGSYTYSGAALIGSLKEGGDYKKTQNTYSTQFNVNAKIIPEIWSIKADFTARITDFRADEWQSDKTLLYHEGPKLAYRSLGWENYAKKTSDKNIYTMTNIYSDFHKDLGKHTLSAVVGFSQEYEGYNSFSAKRKDLITDSYPSIQLATGDTTISESDWAYSIRSAFYRLNYIYDGKYILEMNGRYDGTSRFPKENRFGFFPSFSAAWVFTKENFMSGTSSWLDHGKLRFSYGSLGNQNVSYYSYISSMSTYKMDYLLNGEKPMVVYPSGLVSNALTWEKVYTKNIGFDLNMLSNKLIVSADAYRRDTKDMLTKGKTLPSVLGTAEPRINAADMKTLGWEFSIMWRDSFNLGSKPFNYSTRFILSDARSWITRFDNPTGILTDYYEGMEIGEIWGLTTEGFFIDQADIDNHADQWAVTSYPGDRKMEPGDLKYKDLNKDGKINRGSGTVSDPGDFSIIGNSSNRYPFGIDLSADWNGFDFRLLLQGVGKKDWYPNSTAKYQFFGIYVAPHSNVYEHNMDHWTPENTDAYFPRLKSYIAYADEGDLSINQTRYLQNASYMRCKNLTFGYTLPKNLLKNSGINGVRFYFSGENLFEFTKLCKAFDPEQLSEAGHPMQRTYSFGLNITL